MSRLHNHKYYDHDDRGGGGSNIRKVSFKNNYGRIHKSKKGDKTRGKFFARIKTDDDDVDMGGCEIQGYRVGKRRNFKDRARSPSLRQDTLRPCDWYKIKIPFGSKYDKNNILQMLLKYLAPNVFVPVSYANVGTHAVFYVDDMKAAQLLQEANRKITLPDGHKMIVKVHEGRPPQVPMNDELKEKIKAAMCKRYIAENKALDLSKFVKDPEFSPGIFVTLSRPSVLRAVLQIISEHIPDLFALDLTGNKIQSIDDGSSIEFQKLKNLRILHLGENNIKYYAALNPLKGLELNELVLKDNPVVELCSDRAHFVSEIRRRFPKLTKLDNVELPPVISFDVGEEESKLPTPKGYFICNPEGGGFVPEFLKQFIAMYDSDKRSELAVAYHENSNFSMCSFVVPTSSMSPPNHRLNVYHHESRNLMKVPYYLKRRSRLHIGRSNIVKLLEKLPKTQHDLSSFVVDLPVFTPTLISLSVSGVFREPSNSAESSWPVRHFSRAFVIVPFRQGFCIINDSLFISNATEEEKATFFKAEPQNATPLQSPSSSKVDSSTCGAHRRFRSSSDGSDSGS
ncbi:UNVERIFIED_CONTAM: hypothetical protein PYX00_002033 [Menopon gallinae]|uniref:NTF2 domain-containing protein n=1 Tax=Menopon gallinae TaxID=328185 RepID=A0AAW2IF78_9NEOP